MSNKYKFLLATICGAASVFFFAIASDCPDTANFVYCEINIAGWPWMILSTLFICMAICTAASVNVSGSNKNEK